VSHRKQSSRSAKFSTKLRHFAFTLVELIVVIAIIATLLSMILPDLVKSRMRSARINCVSNLKQVGVGFRLYSNDNGGVYPRLTNLVGNGYVWTNFAAAGIEITSPKVLLCPTDTNRWPPPNRTFPVNFSNATNGFGNPAFQENCLSYFYGLSANETEPNTILSGDRNITANQARRPNGPDVTPMWSYAGKGPEGGIPGIPLGSTGPAGRYATPACGWNSAIHHFNGNIGLGDGSVQQTSTPWLAALLNASEETNNFCLFPIKSPGEK
jgi:prepilin-type N-terminal cleavage/methylation domain-containing protein